MNKTVIKPKSIDQAEFRYFGCRFPIALYNALKERAVKNNRSLNREVIHILQVTLLQDTKHGTKQMNSIGD